MHEVSFLHCADLHLDMPFTSLGHQPGIAARRREELKETLARIIRIVQKEAIQLLLISGDVYEHHYIRNSTLQWIDTLFATIPDTRIIILPGNHDPYTADSAYRTHRWGDNVSILCPQQPCVTLDEWKVCIYGLVQPGIMPSVLDGEKKTGYIHILLAHGTLDMNPGPGVFYPLQSRELDGLGMDYIALGHFHNRIEGTRECSVVYNPGSPEPLGFDEPGEHGIFTGHIRKDDALCRRLDVQFCPVGERRYIQKDIFLQGAASLEEVEKAVCDALHLFCAGKDLFSVTLKGQTAQGFCIQLSMLRERLSQFFYIKCKDETTMDYGIDEMMQEPGIRGVFCRRMRERIQAEQDADKRILLEKALFYGLEALTRGRIEIPQDSW